MKNYDYLVGNDVSVRISEKLFKTGIITKWDNSVHGPIVTVNLHETHEPLILNEFIYVSAVTTKLENVVIFANETNNPL
jgi:hypothetical protein